MVLPLKTLKPYIISTFLKHQILPAFINNAYNRSLSTNTNEPSSSSTKSLSALFKAAVGLTKEDTATQWGRDVSPENEDEHVHQVNKLLWKIEEDVRSMKGMNHILKRKTNLSSLFKFIPGSMLFKNEQVKKNIESEDFRDKQDQKLKTKAGLSQEMVLFVKCLYKKGYLKDANFLLHGELHFNRLSTVYARGYLRSAAERFGTDHEELAKCLSESDMKRLALFGCPDSSHKTTNAAKRLRSYFNIQEDIVCRACKLKSSCKYKFYTDSRIISDLNIVDVMRILTLYSLELVPPELTLQDEVKDSCSKLLKQVVAYSQ